MIKSFEGLRGLAAVFVALYHLEASTSHVSPLSHGYLFVDLFFVLSGYVICSAYAQRLDTARQIRSFVIRRFGRLFPLLIFSTFLFVLGQNAIVLVKRKAIAMGYGASLSSPDVLDYVLPTAAETVSTMTMTQGLGFFDRLTLNYVSWSISTEFYTYLLFAITCLAMRGSIRQAAFGLLSAIALAATLWATIQLHGCLNGQRCFDICYDFGFTRCIASFFLGALMFALRKKAAANPGMLQMIALTALVCFFYLLDLMPGVALVSPFLFALTVLSLSSDTGFFAKLLKFHPLQLLGQRSYSIYMMHPVLLLAISMVAKRLDGAAAYIVILAAYLAILVIVSGWTYRWIEDPLRKAFNRIADANEGTRVQAPSSTG
jgi:peptidoglycan/LPS O-acetylase OafA/YrhL